MPQYILFDLDGTLTDPGIGITNSVMHALEKMGFPVPEREKLYPFIGPPLVWSFMNFYGCTEEEAKLGVKYYREYFTDTGIFENRVYDGIPETLAALRAAGKTVVMATSKPEDFARRIAERFDLARWFDFIAGSLMDETRTSKAEVIAYALESLGAKPEDCLMIGDREHDVLGAAAHGIPCLGVLYGYGSREELLGAGAVGVVEAPEEIPRAVGI